MRTAYGAFLAVVLAAVSLVHAAPPEVPKEVKLSGAGLGRIEVSVPDGAEVGFHATFTDAEVFLEELAPRKGKRRFLLQAQPKADKDGKQYIPSGKYSLTWWTKGETEGTHTTIVVAGTGPDVAPDPKPKPPPKPDDPAKSFRVFLVWESGKAMPAAQVSAMWGKEVETYLDARTGGKWMRRDKDTATDTDTTALKDLWAAARPMITRVPAIVAEADGKITVADMPGTPAETVKRLKELAGDK